MKDFRDALLWHMTQHQTTIAALAKGSGVSADVIKKVRSREGASAKAEDAWRIAAYFGKELPQFINPNPGAAASPRAVPETARDPPAGL